MDLPQGNASEALVLASFSYGEVISRFLTPAGLRALQFALAVTLIISSSNGANLKGEDNFGPLPPLYLFQVVTSFRHNFK